ncbi:unnamed protein product [Alopecurus aequalis]
MVGPRGVRRRNPALLRAVVRPPAVHRLLPSAPVGYISLGVPKRKWGGFFPAVSSEVASRNRKKHRVIHDRFMKCGKAAPFTSPLKKGWVGFTAEESEIFKADYAGSLLSEIHKDSNQWTICVLVSRMWHYRGGTNEGPIKHTDLVLLDNEGTTCTGRSLQLRQSAYRRPVESPYMVQFTRYTVVTEKPGLEDTFPFYTYNLTAFEDIPLPGYTPTSFIDVIGRITMVSDVIPVQAMHQATASNTRTIMLADLQGKELRTLPKMARGIKGLSGSSACRWYVDEDIPDINSFRASLGDKFTPIADYVPTCPDALVPRVQEIPVDKSVKELTDLDPFVDMDKRFFCSVTVARLGSDQRWWFPSCSSCRKSARYNGYQYKCSNDDCISVHADLTISRYCVSVITSDGIAEAEFVLFDKVALGVVGRPLIALLRQRYPGRATVEDLASCARNDVYVPPEITRHVGQKYKLLVCISKKWQVRNSEELSFQVSRIEETYRPELPPPVFGVASESAVVSVSNSATTPQLPVLAQVASSAAHTPPALPRTPVAPVSRISPLTPAPRSLAPLRGARRTLFATLAKEKLQSVVEAADLAEQDAAQAAMDGDLAVVQEKNIETLVLKGDDAAVVADRPGEVVSSGADGAASVADKTLEVLPSKNKRVAAAAAAKTQNKKSK